MTNHEKRLARALVGLYRVVRFQQEAISRLMIDSEALHETLVSPSVRRVFEQNYEQVSENPKGQVLEGSLKLIDATIQLLQRECEQ